MHSFDKNDSKDVNIETQIYFFLNSPFLNILFIKLSWKNMDNIIIHKYIPIENSCINISQYSCFTVFLLCDQISASLLSIIDLLYVTVK